MLLTRLKKFGHPTLNHPATCHFSLVCARLPPYSVASQLPLVFAPHLLSDILLFHLINSISFRLHYNVYVSSFISSRLSYICSLIRIRLHSVLLLLVHFLYACYHIKVALKAMIILARFISRKVRSLRRVVE